MTPISRGFGGRRRDDVDPSRIPLGQYYERGFPVLSAGPTPRTALEEWTFSIQGAVDEARWWTWDEFTALTAEDVTVDIHCVTKWVRGLALTPQTSPASGSLRAARAAGRGRRARGPRAHLTPDGPRRAPIRWHVATVRDARAESPTARTLVLDVPA
jgi:DMSO/TMAO reductase YedYZ molybdopterin-dependent catalytic subunit